MDPEAILTGIGAILTAAGGTVLVVREFRRRDRIESAHEIEELSAEVHECRQLHIRWRRYAFELREMIADLGHEPPVPPDPL